MADLLAMVEATKAARLVDHGNLSENLTLLSSGLAPALVRLAQQGFVFNRIYVMNLRHYRRSFGDLVSHTLVNFQPELYFGTLVALA
jgi:hypothetical protein